MAKWAETLSMKVEAGRLTVVNLDGQELPWHIEDTVEVEYVADGYSRLHITIPVISKPDLPTESTLEKDLREYSLWSQEELVSSWGKPGDTMEIGEKTPEPDGSLIFVMEGDEDEDYPFLTKGDQGWSWYKMPDITSKRIGHNADEWVVVREAWDGRVLRVVGSHE